MPRERRINIMGILEWVKEQLFGKDPEDQRYTLWAYGGATLFFIVIAVPYLIIYTGRGIPLWWGLLSGLGAYIAMIVAIRVFLAFFGAMRSIYSGSDTGEMVGDDFSEIEALVARSRFNEAIGKYREEYELRDGEDERPLIRIGEVYWLELKDYPAAVGQFGIVARAAKDPQLRLDMFTRMLEIYRDHMPDNPGFDRLSKIVLSEFPGTLAARIAEQHFSLIGG